jgi:predicted DNA-binding transcriptional regulator YafY
MSRSDRLFDLLQTLRTYRYPVQAAVLAKRLEVTVRTVYRDIDTLRSQGAPIDGEAGLGFQLRPGFLLPPLMFDAAEIEALALGARWVAQRADGPLRQAAIDALARIAAVLPPKLRQELEDTPLLIGPGTGSASAKVDLSQVREAIRAERRIEITYRDKSGAASRRVLWPFAVSFFDDTRILVAWCELRQDYRSFRIDQIERLDILDSSYPRPRHALLAEWHERSGVPRQDLSADS